MILENITMEMTANDTAPESEGIRGKTKAGLKQDMAMDRFYRWTAGLMSPAEEKEYSKAVTRYIEGKRQ